MIKAKTLCIWLLLSSAVFAQQPRRVMLDVTNVSDGDYLLLKTGDRLTLVPLLIVIPDSTPTPDPPLPPSPDLTARAIAVRDLALAVTGDPNRATTALSLAAVYSEISAKIKIGDLKGRETIEEVIRAGVDLLLLQSSVTDQWQPVRDVINAHWVALAQEGATDSEYAGYLGEAAAGLRASAPSQVDVVSTDISEIIDILIRFLPKTK